MSVIGPDPSREWESMTPKQLELRRLTEPWRTHAAAEVQYRHDRDQAIRRYVKQGMTVRDAAEAVGLHHTEDGRELRLLGFGRVSQITRTTKPPARTTR